MTGYNPVGIRTSRKRKSVLAVWRDGIISVYQDDVGRAIIVAFGLILLGMFSVGYMRVHGII